MKLRMSGMGSGGEAMYQDSIKRVHNCYYAHISCDRITLTSQHDNLLTGIYSWFSYSPHVP